MTDIPQRALDGIFEPTESCHVRAKTLCRSLLKKVPRRMKVVDRRAHDHLRECVHRPSKHKGPERLALPDERSGSAHCMKSRHVDVVQTPTEFTTVVVPGTAPYLEYLVTIVIRPVFECTNLVSVDVRPPRSTTSRTGVGLGHDWLAIVASGAVPYSLIFTSDNVPAWVVAVTAFPTMCPHGGGVTSTATLDAPTFPTSFHGNENCSSAPDTEAGYSRPHRTLLAM